MIWMPPQGYPPDNRGNRIANWRAKWKPNSKVTSSEKKPFVKKQSAAPLKTDVFPHEFHYTLEDRALKIFKSKDFSFDIDDINIHDDNSQPNVRDLSIFTTIQSADDAIALNICTSGFDDEKQLVDNYQVQICDANETSFLVDDLLELSNSERNTVSSRLREILDAGIEEINTRELNFKSVSLEVAQQEETGRGADFSLPPLLLT